MKRRDVALSFFLATAWLACGGDDATTAVSSSASTTTTAAGASGGAGGGSGGGGGATGGTGGSAVPMSHYLYVANGSSDTISRFSIDEASGALTDLGTTPAAGGPGSIALSQDHTRLYMALRNSQSVIAFTIDAGTGNLAEIATTTVGINPVYLWVDAAGGFLLMSSYGGNTVRVHTIAGDGSITAGAVDTEATGVNPHSVITHPSNAWAFVPLTNNNPDQILQYAFNPGSGALTSNGTAAAAMGSGPRHMVFHPNGQWLYVVNEHDDTVAIYDFNASSGMLAARMAWSTLPTTFNGANNTCADIHITPDGRFVYASNRGHDSIAMFAAAASDGALTSLGQEPTEPTPREIEVAFGRFVYAAGQASGMLAAYSIEATSGVLTPIQTYAVGGQPQWVTAVSLPTP